ncbi:hypothetical protein EJ03DRAFT_106155 [Teratosphaeria nubilosa]|uniref:Uncharacterized protein n=1 Tax=Teratosphaeria nubilosa TaxID=161662 RepID=A0A6G1L924_9PEZI|nr:hypothetical protein EJ03DRAFT_106155 [Teratosphaeria nubilosa]
MAAPGSKHVKGRTSMTIATSIIRKIRRISTIGVSSSSDRAPEPEYRLRHCQEQYFSGGAQTTKRWRVMSRHSRADFAKDSHKEGIFVVHAANIGIPGTPRPVTTVVVPGSMVRNAQRSEDLEIEKKVFYNAINNARRSEGARHVKLDPAIAADVQAYAETLPQLQPRGSPWEDVSTRASTFIEQGMPQHGRESVRLIGPPGYRALACCELWCSGKHIRRSHFGQHVRRLMHISSFSRRHPAGRQRHLYTAFETMIDPKWEVMGIGRTADGRWVVEFFGRGDTGLRIEKSEINMDVHELPAFDQFTEQDGDGMVVKERTLRRKQSSVDLAAAYAELCAKDTVPEPLLIRHEADVDDLDSTDRMEHVERHRRMALAALNGDRGQECC